MLQLAIMILTMYVFILLFAMVLTWFGHATGRFGELLGAITRPFLEICRKIFPVRFGMLDLSPLIGIAVLYMLLQILQIVDYQGTVSLGIVLGAIVISLWATIQGICAFLIILMIVRLFTLLSHGNPVSPIVLNLDRILTPILAWVDRTFFPNRRMSARGLLVVAGLILVALVIGGAIGSEALATFLFTLPV